MITKIVSIGNSKGIRLPKYIIQQLTIKDEVDLIVDSDNNQILLKPVTNPRKGWDKAFSEMRTNNDDQLRIDDSLDFNEWQW